MNPCELTIRESGDHEYTIEASWLDTKNKLVLQIKVPDPKLVSLADLFRMAEYGRATGEKEGVKP